MPYKEIITHYDLGNQPEVYAKDERGLGGAHQKYQIHYNVRYEGDEHPLPEIVELNFMSLEQGGVTNESLLAILIDRLQGFQSGDFPCEENQRALDGCKSALRALKQRTRDRRTRGVEGEAKE